MRHRLMTHPLFLYLLLLPPRFYSLPPNKIKHYYSVAANKKMLFYFVVSNKICTFAAKSKYMEKELFRTIIAENQEYIGRIPLV